MANYMTAALSSTTRPGRIFCRYIIRCPRRLHRWCCPWPISDQHVMHNTWPSNACAKSSDYRGESQRSDYGNLLRKLRLACASVACGVPSSKITCATQAAHNCIPACVSCERARGCSGEPQGSDYGIYYWNPAGFAQTWYLAHLAHVWHRQHITANPHPRSVKNQLIVVVNYRDQTMVSNH